MSPKRRRGAGRPPDRGFGSEPPTACEACGQLYKWREYTKMFRKYYHWGKPEPCVVYGRIVA